MVILMVQASVNKIMSTMTMSKKIWSTSFCIYVYDNMTAHDVRTAGPVEKNFIDEDTERGECVQLQYTKTRMQDKDKRENMTIPIPDHDTALDFKGGMMHRHPHEHDTRTTPQYLAFHFLAIQKNAYNIYFYQNINF